MLDRLLRRYPGYTYSSLLAEDAGLLRMVKILDLGGDDG